MPKGNFRKPGTIMIGKTPVGPRRAKVCVALSELMEVFNKRHKGKSVAPQVVNLFHSVGIPMSEDNLRNLSHLGHRIRCMPRYLGQRTQ